MTEATSGLENKAGNVEGMFGEFMSAFEEFKRSNDARLDELEKRGSADVIITEKVERLNQVLDGAKAAIEAAGGSVQE